METPFQCSCMRLVHSQLLSNSKTLTDGHKGGMLMTPLQVENDHHFEIGRQGEWREDQILDKL